MRWPRPLAATAQDAFDLHGYVCVESVRTAHRKEHSLGRPIHRRGTRHSLPCILPSMDQPANAHPLPHATVGVDRGANCFHRRSADTSDRLPDKDRSARSSSEDLSRCQNLFSMQPRISVPVCEEESWRNEPSLQGQPASGVRICGTHPSEFQASLIRVPQLPVEQHDETTSLLRTHESAIRTVEASE